MRITVVGGYVGLVTGACFAELGHTVNIVEIDAGKAAAINAGRAPTSRWSPQAGRSGRRFAMGSAPTPSW
jgi:UDP-N-acetyl-D-mannosaminuronate dehydrogenase